MAALISGSGAALWDIVDEESTCTGGASVIIDPEPRPPMGLAMVRFEISLRDCPPGTIITDVHIDNQAEGYVDSWIGSGLTEFELKTGALKITSTNAGVPPSRAQAVIALPTAYYLHFHSRSNPGGLLRGELRPR